MQERLVLTGAAAACLALGVIGCSSRSDGELTPSAEGSHETHKALTNDENGDDWLAYGRTYSETHYSPLTEISADNVGELGLAWSLELGTVKNGATVPLEVDGVLYFTVGHSFVHAVDARTGELLWKFDPKAAEAAGHKLRYSWGPRGIAFWNDKVYVGTVDGRLMAIDAKTGKEVWSQQTVDRRTVANITGAPRVFDGKVIIGHGGAEFGAIRAYVTTYDAETGEQLWRWWVVPGNPADGFENAAMERAAKTWTGEWWSYGGGGTVWNGITYDPEFDRIYLGTGNGQPWNQKIRSPGGGDNLFLSSIVALEADTGEYVWHHQQVPANTWDYNSVMDLALATLEIDGAERKVLLHAPKDGFVYIYDRENGKLLSAEKFDKVTWAERVDLETARPVVAEGARDGGIRIWPGSGGAHNWMPMSYNEALDLLFIPVQRLGGFVTPGPDPAEWRYKPGGMNYGYESDPRDVMKPPPAAASAPPPPPPDEGTSYIVAWDPEQQQEVWRQPTPGFWNGGTMSTAGGLVFQGHADGMFNAYDGKTGEPLWKFDTGMGIAGAPISYAVDDKQYVAVVAGWGGTGAAFFGMITANFGWQSRIHPHRLLVFALGEDGQLSADIPEPMMATPVDDPSFRIDEKLAAVGAELYGRTCASCHGGGVIAGGYAPDLRASAVPLSAEAFRSVVHDGAMVPQAMPQYDELSDEQLTALRHFIRQRARQSLE